MGIVQALISVAVFAVGLVIINFLPDVRNFTPEAAAAITQVFGTFFAFVSIFQFIGHLISAVIAALVLEAGYWAFVWGMWALRMFGKS